jgi:transcriptional regulator with XRE-family HTH domain
MSGFAARLDSLTRGRSLSAVAECCGLSKDCIRRYIKGEARPSMGALVAMADFFGVTVDYLLGRDFRC